MSTKGKQRRKVLPPLPQSLDINSNSFADDTDVDDLSGDSKIILDSMMRKMDEVKSELLARLDEKIKVIEKLESEVDYLRRENTDIKNRLEDIESYQRSESLIISGNALPEVKNGENCSHAVVDILKNQMNFVLPKEAISAAYRLGKKSSAQTADKRNIFVKLNKREDKQSILASCKTAKPSNLYINENLTPTRYKILTLLKLVRRAQPSRLSAVGSRDGKVFAWIKFTDAATATKGIFSSILEVENLCGQLGLDFSQLSSRIRNN